MINGAKNAQKVQKNVKVMTKLKQNFKGKRPKHLLLLGNVRHVHTDQFVLLFSTSG